MADGPPPRKRTPLDLVVETVRVVFVVFASGATIGLGAIGLWQIFVALKDFDYHGTNSPATIVATLEGLEFLLLAPLAFVVTVSMSRYLEELILKSADDADHRVHRVKGLVVSLMMTTIATDIVKRLVSQSFSNVWETVILEYLGLLVISVFLIIILVLPRWIK